MISVYLETSQGGFIISNLPYTKVKLCYKNSEYFIEKKQDHFFLSKELLYSIANHGESIIKIYGQTLEKNSYVEIKLDGFFIQISSKLFFSYNQTTYYLYISQQNTLRIIANQKPSVLSYYKKHEVKMINKTEEKITFQLTIISKYFKLLTCSIVIKDRKKQLETVFESHQINSYQIEHNQYSNIVNFSIDKATLEPLYPSGFNLNNYDTTIFDLFFKLTIKEQPITDYAIRMHYFDDFTLDENWIDLEECSKLLIRTYPTEKYHNLSFRISAVPKETYLCYRLLKSDQQFNSNSHNKKIMLITEYPHKAQDTGFSFFTYMYQKHKKEFDVYYVISANSKDLSNLKKYKKNILFYKSKKHLEIFLKADVLAHSHSHFYGFPFVSDFTIEHSKSIFKVFLQHGLQSIRNMSYLYGKKPKNPFTNLFIVSSDREKEVVVNDYHYDEEEVAITGMSRFDSLLSRKGKCQQLFSKKKLLIMPSWRKDQDKLSDEEFMATDFFKSFQSLLLNDRLKDYSSKYNIKILFYLHTNFQKYTHLFKSDFVIIVHEGTTTVQNLLKSSSILVTDFSSVALDFALLKRPILYYQFDGPPIEARPIDMNTFFPGDIVSTEEELISKITVLSPTSKMKPCYEEGLSDLYKYNDTNARQRIYNEIICRIDI